MKRKIISISIVNSGKKLMIFVHRDRSCRLYYVSPLEPSGKRILQAMIKLATG